MKQIFLPFLVILFFSPLIVPLLIFLLMAYIAWNLIMGVTFWRLEKYFEEFRKVIYKKIIEEQGKEKEVI